MKYLLVSSLFFISNIYGQDCYLNLGNYSGVPITREVELNSLSCELGDSLGFQNSEFKVYDFVFYQLDKHKSNNIDSNWDRVVSTANEQSDFYILFGRKDSNNGVFDEFKVKVKLPDMINSICIGSTTYLEDRITQFINLSRESLTAEQVELEVLRNFTNLITCEICDNGIDDDGDGIIDCNDLDCVIIQQFSLSVRLALCSTFPRFSNVHLS